MRDTELAASFAIAQAKRRNRSEVGRDELLLGCLQTISLFGVVRLGGWTFDLEELGIDWLENPGGGTEKVAYSQGVVDVFDRAARIAKVDGPGTIRVAHLLAAFAVENDGLMGELKQSHGINSASWRIAVAQIGSVRPDMEAAIARGDDSTRPRAHRDYLTPEEAAEALSIHVQTLRAYVRSGKLPALRLAGERAIRIRRTDLETVLEPLVPQT
jgi:excisionase family DNA binding protein